MIIPNNVYVMPLRVYTKQCTLTKIEGKWYLDNWEEWHGNIKNHITLTFETEQEAREYIILKKLES